MKSQDWWIYSILSEPASFGNNRKELSNEEKSALITIAIKAFGILKRSNEEKNKEEKEFKKVRRIKIE